MVRSCSEFFLALRNSVGSQEGPWKGMALQELPLPVVHLASVAVLAQACRYLLLATFSLLFVSSCRF